MTVVKNPVKTDANEQTPLIAHTTHSRPAEHETGGEKEKGDKTSASKQHMLSPPPTIPGGTTMVIRADLIGRKGLGNEIWRKRGKDTKPITHEGPPPTNRGGTSDTAHVEEG